MTRRDRAGSLHDLPPKVRRRVARSSGLRALAVAGALTGAVTLPGCFGCFVRGTRVATPRGPRRIEELTAGDDVHSFDTERGGVVVRPIVEVMRARREEILIVRAGELSIEGVTPEHPFWDARTRTWVRAADLTLSHRLLAWLGSGDPRELAVDSITRRPAREATEVFNLTVGGGPEQNFFAEGLLVHNKSPPVDPDAATTDAAGRDAASR